MKPIISNNVKYWQKEYRGDIRKIESNFFGKNNFSTEFKRFYLVLKAKKIQRKTLKNKKDIRKYDYLQVFFILNANDEKINEIFDNDFLYFS